MNEFKQATEKAAEELVPEQGYGGDLSTMLATAIIAKHFAPLAEQFAMLVEALSLMESVCDGNVQMGEMLYGRDEEGGVSIPQSVSRIYAILNNPLIAPLLKEEK